MRLDPILAEVEAAIQAQLRLADPSVSEAATDFLEAFRPAMRTGLTRAAEYAAAEVGAQLGDRRVDVRLSDGEPELVVTAATSDLPPPNPEDSEARITLRLPGSLKTVIEDAASTSGESVNGWVVDALRSGARRSGRGTHVTESFEL
jgi:uncharacterized protein (DUF1778 family)